METSYKIDYSFTTDGDDKYGDTGNICSKTVTRNGGSPETTSFQYDDYNKLTEITHPDSTTETLSYDDNGQLVKSEKSTGETTNYQWNDQGMLVKVILPNGEPVEYFYDGNQRLISRKSSDGVDNFLQSGWDIVTKMDDVGKRTYYTGMSALSVAGSSSGSSSAVESEDSVKYFHYNHRGDTVLVTDANGEILHNLNYEAYGKPTNNEGIPINTLSLTNATDPNNNTYSTGNTSGNITGGSGGNNLPNLFVGASGIRYDTKTNLHYMRFRWFSGEQMRFISSDPILAGNRFSYANNNPVKWIDPVGLHEITVDFQEATYPNGTHFINVHVEVNFDNPVSVSTSSASSAIGQIAGSSVNSGNIAGNNNSKILQSALVNAGIATAVYTGAGITVGVPVIAMGALLPPFLTRLAEAQLAEMMAQYFIEYPILKHLHHLGAKAYSIFGENSPLARLSVFEHIDCIHSRLAEQGYPVQEGKDFWGKFFKNKKKRRKFLTKLLRITREVHPKRGPKMEEILIKFLKEIKLMDKEGNLTYIYYLIGFISTYFA